ncbi:MAG TPA: amidohydrolase family protein [Verrucomicrobiae bacterium]|nr:amidohydrolase family protein [Verrucomicrobiae bacterium]
MGPAHPLLPAVLLPSDRRGRRRFLLRPEPHRPDDHPVPRVALLRHHATDDRSAQTPRGHGSRRHRRRGAQPLDAQRVLRATRAAGRVARLANDAYAELIAKEPKRFKGFASIPMDDPEAALRELDRALGELKLNGVVVLSNINGRALTDARYRPFFEECDRRGVCVFVHPMIPANAEAFSEYVLGPIIGFPFDTTLAVARLCYAGVFQQLPRIRWILGHLGGAVPYLFERLDNGWRDFAECRANIDELPSVYLKRLYYDTVSFSTPSLRLALEQVGADHLVMGSDYPHLLGSIERSVTSIEGLEIAREQKDAIFSGTARRILNGL